MTQQVTVQSDSGENRSSAVDSEPGIRQKLIDEQPIREVSRDGVDYTLIGTAHVSRASADAVSELAASGQFDAIAVELCQARYDALTAERKWTDLDLYRVLRDRKAGLVMANLALSAYQRRIAEQFGIEPGAEMRAAAVAAKQHDLPLQLVDRDRATTQAFGQILNDLGKQKGGLADHVVSTSPDVTVSTNLGGWVTRRRDGTSR